MTTTALMRYHQQQQRHHHHQHQQHHQSHQSSSSSSSSTEQRTSLISPVNNINCQTSDRSYNNHSDTSSSSQRNRISPSYSNIISSNGNQNRSMNNGFGNDRGRNETNNDNHSTNSQRNHLHNSVHLPEPYHNVNNFYNYHNNNLDAFHANLVQNPWRSSNQKVSSDYGQNYQPHLWSLRTGAQAAAQNAVLVATAQAVEAIQQAEQGNEASNSERVQPESVPENNRSSTQRATRNSNTSLSNSTESSSLTVLDVPTEQNVSDLAKKLLAEASSALRIGSNVENDRDIKPATITSTTKIVKAASSSVVVNENVNPKSAESTEVKRENLENTESKESEMQITSDSPSDNTKRIASSPSSNEEKRATSQTFITLTSCRKTTSILSDSPPNSSNSSSLKNATSCSTSFTSISASSSSSSTPSCFGSVPTVNTQVFAHPTALLPVISSDSFVNESSSNKDTVNNSKLECSSKNHKNINRNDSNAEDKKVLSIKRSSSSGAIDVPNITNIEKPEEASRKSSFKKLAKSESEYAKQSKSSESLFSPYNISSNSSHSTIGSNYQPYSHHQPYDVPQHGSHSSQSHFHRSVEQAGRVPWNLSHLVGSFQSPSSTSAGATSSEYAANQAVSAGGGASAGSSGSLPHPLPHYSAHHYSSSPQTSAASYHQPDLATWGGPGGGGVGGANLGMHSQSSPLTSLTSVAMAAASAVSADSPSGSNTGGGGYAPTKMDPESLASMYYPHQATSSPAGNVDPASESAPAAASSSATASSTTTSSLSATTAAMASARAETAASVDPLTFQSIPPTLESQEVISTLHQYFNQSEMPQLVEGAWIDPALSSVPYHPDYGDGRGGYKDRKKEIIKNWTKSNTAPPTSSAANGSSGAPSSIVDPIAAAHASLSSRSSNIPSGAVPSPYNEYYTPYGATGTKEDAASAQLRDYYAQQAQAHAVQATYAAYAAQDPALYPYAAAGLSVHPGNHHHHLAGATASHSGHPHHGHHSHTSASHLGLNPGGSIGASATPGGGMIGGIGGVGGMHGGNSGSRRERKRLKQQALAAEQANLANAGIGGIGSPGSSLSRDERKAHNLRLPITVMDIINLPMDEFNDLLSKHELTEEQLTLCRDIRRRGKNKVAARNCRKRKIDQIKQLEDDVGRIRNQKSDLIREHERLMAQRTHWTDMVKRLHDHVLKELGHDPNLWQLQMDHNRQVHILPRSQSQETDPTKVPRPYHYAPSLGPPMMEGGGLPSQR